MPGSLQIWLHPKRTHAQMQEMCEELDTARADILARERQIEELHTLTDTLKAERTRLQADNTRLGLKHKRLQEDYDTLTGQIAEINTLFERVKDMKEAYERRITRLKGQVADLQKALQRATEEAPDDITPIKIVTDRKPTEETPPAPAADSSVDWYLPLDI